MTVTELIAELQARANPEWPVTLLEQTKSRLGEWSEPFPMELEEITRCDETNSYLVGP